MKRVVLVLFPLLALAAPALPPDDDLTRVEAEPHPDKRAHLALENADDALKQARESYDKGESENVTTRLHEVEQSVELAETSLKQTGKNPSRAPKHFKYAELRTRDLLRKMESFRESMSVADRPVLDHAISVVQKIHDTLLDGIMGKNK